MQSERNGANGRHPTVQHQMWLPKTQELSQPFQA